MLVFLQRILKEMQSGEDAVMKNSINCLVHFYIFKSITSKLILEVIENLFKSYKEYDLELLLFVLHNIGI